MALFGTLTTNESSSNALVAANERCSFEFHVQISTPECLMPISLAHNKNGGIASVRSIKL